MAILTVGPTSTFPTIAAAMAAAGTGDIISLEAGYGNETATVTVNGLSFDGGSTSANINLQLATGIGAITLLGTAPINVLDGPDANAVVGNDGDNIISVSSGVDVVTAGNGTDRLIIDYSAATASITGTTVNVTDGGTHAVTFTGVENFTISTGSGNDTVTVADGSNVVNSGGGDDTITAGNGPNIIDGGANNDTITAGSGANTIAGGLGNDTIVAGDGGNTVNGGGGDDGISTGIGDDVVIAGLGNDTILTSAGADVTTVNGGIDTVDSGSESDRLIVDFSSSTTNVNGGVTGGTLAGGYDGAFANVAGTSSIVFQQTENFTVTTGSGSDVIATGDGDDVLDGGAGGDQLNGGGGADALLIGLGSDVLDGGAGTDTTIFSAARANYQVTDLGGGVLRSIDLRAGSPDGTDTLVNMEGFVFTDGTFDAVSILNDAPVLGGDRAVAVSNGGTVTVTAADLTATDPDNTNAQLVYTVTGALHGAVLLSGAAASSFTEADILANAVSFQHDGSATNGSFTVSLTDGTAAPQVATVAAAVDNDAPVLGGDRAIAVANGGMVTVTSADLTATDSDNTNAQLVYTVTGAMHGVVLLSGAAASSFTEADILANAVSFQHDGSATDGSFTVSLTDGTAAPQVATVAVDADAAVPPAPRPPSNDFNGDAHSDILWQTTGGQLAIWAMDGAQIASAGYTRSGSTNVGLPGSDWHIADTGDFDGDGMSDLFWRTDSGALAVWEMDGTQIKEASYIKAGSANVGTPGADWHVLGTADFDGDAKSDLLWKTDSGALAIWEMDGAQIKEASYIKSGSTNVGSPGSDWHIVGTGDFDGDAKSDLLWRTDSGALAIWQMDGTQIKTAGFIKMGSANVGAPGSDWHIADTGDFDGDGKSDLLWRTESGALAIWQMDGTQIKAADYIRIGSANVGTPGPDWHLVGADDYDGNGVSDLLWRTDSGALAVWEMNGNQVAAAEYTRSGSTNVGAPGSDWNIIQHQYDLV